MLLDKYHEKLDKELLEPGSENGSHQRKLVLLEHLWGAEKPQERMIFLHEGLQILELLVSSVDQTAVFGSHKQRVRVFLGNFLSNHARPLGFLNIVDEVADQLAVLGIVKLLA